VGGNGLEPFWDASSRVNLVSAGGNGLPAVTSWNASSLGTQAGHFYPWSSATEVRSDGVYGVIRPHVNRLEEGRIAKVADTRGWEQAKFR
jgi:hypothetical protein